MSLVTELLAVAGAGYVIMRGMPDAEALAAVVIAEAGDIDPGPEWAGIMQVAQNRARAWGATLDDVIRSRVEGRPVWNNARAFLRMLDNAPQSPRYRRAMLFAAAQLMGAHRNLIGARKNFCHPGSMGALPSWAVSSSDGGKASYEPLRIGRALFS